MLLVAPSGFTSISLFLLVEARFHADHMHPFAAMTTQADDL
jgi:hypothetical protein